MIKYLGSKRRLLPAIVELLGGMPEVRTVVDLFAGSSRVGYALKQAGYRVLANDHNAYAATLARCYVQADRDEWQQPAEQLIREFNALPGRPGYFTATFCERARYFQPKNGARIDAIRDSIAQKGLDPELEAVLLVSLMEAADRVDSTTGVQMAYLKNWSVRAHHDLQLRLPALLPRAKHGKGEAHCSDALLVATSLRADAVYLDPPYNQHSYLGNYHIWESLVRWDQPPVYGIACKRVDCRTRQSVFNSRPRFRSALLELLQRLAVDRLIVSYSNEGFLARHEMELLLTSLWDGRAVVTTIECDSRRYIGAQIGIHDKQGRKVGQVSHLRNKEYLYVVERPASHALEASMAASRPQSAAASPLTAGGSR